jgi:hypothetical protein
MVGITAVSLIYKTPPNKASNPKIRGFVFYLIEQKVIYTKLPLAYAVQIV